jgi:hypothetical protein
VLDTDKNFAQFCDLDAFFDNVFRDDDTDSTRFDVTAPADEDVLDLSTLS